MYGDVPLDAEEFNTMVVPSQYALLELDADAIGDVYTTNDAVEAVAVHE